LHLISAMITRATIDKIFETARIEEVIGDFVSLKRSGSNLKGLSPFSNEKTPSFMVSPAKQIFKDFSSGKGGNVVSFLMEHEHYTYPEALRYLAKKYGIEIEETEQSAEEKQKRSEQESLFLVNEFANSWFQEQLHQSEEGKQIGLSYFRERGFTDQIIKEFQLGYSPEDWEGFSKVAIRASYEKEFLVKTGLSIEKDQRLIDRFRGRVMFPILSHTGRVLGFGGRTLQSGAKVAKYLNSPESEVYHKSKVLYGIYQAKSELGKLDECLLVEGYTDVISLHQAGVKNVVASSGTALTRDQINLVKRFTRNITILYDGDPAGIKASLRGIDLILEEGMNVRVLLFPDGEDPDSYSRKVSGEELRDYIKDESRDFVKFKAGLLLGESSEDPLEKSKAAREIVTSIAKIPDELLRSAYIQECGSLMQIDERVLFSELAQIRKSEIRREEREHRLKEQKEARLKVVKEEPGANTAPITTSKHYHQERAICWLLLNYGDRELIFTEANETEDAEDLPERVAEFIVAELEEDKLTLHNPVFAAIISRFSEELEASGEVLDPMKLIRAEESHIVNEVVSLVSEKHHLHDWKRKNIHPPDKEDYLKDFTVQSVLRYKEKRTSEMIGEIQDKLKTTSAPDDEYHDRIKKIQRLTELRRLLNSKLNRVL
jgi:DNA primase